MQNLLDLTPVRLKEHRINESKGDGAVSVLVPKFGTGKIGAWLRKRIKHPDYRVNLDDFGTHVWNLCDGKNRVRDIGISLQKTFGDSVEPVYDRLSVFFRQLEKSKLIAFKEIQQNNKEK